MNEGGDGQGGSPQAGAYNKIGIRVYYEDTDFSGLVYHASYLRFLERGRTEMLRDLGVHQQALHAGEESLVFVVRRMTIDWLKPARMDDQIIVETRAADIGGASLTLDQRILRGDDLLLTALVTVAAVANGRPKRLPADLRAKFAKAPRSA